jgi:outer membrane protein, heavy metal efflux system
MRVVAALVPLVVLASGPPLRAQEPLAPGSAAPPLHLADAIEWARVHHPSLAAAAARVDAARQGPEMARSLMPPMLDATIWQWPVTSANPADVNMYMFMLQQELPGRGKRNLRVAVAERSVDRMVADAGVRERAVKTRVVQAYVALRATEREIAAVQAAQPAASELVRASEAAYAAGRGAQAAVVRAALGETEIAERLVMLQADADLRRVALNIAMGRPPSTPVGALDDEAPVADVPPLTVLLDRAVEAHPELRASRAQIAEADASLAVAQAERKPDWVVQGGYMLMPGDAGAWTARVGLTWPTAPWSRKRLAASTAEATANAQAARADLETSQLEIARMIAEARVTLVGALARLALVRDTMRPQSSHVVDASRLAFAAGQIPLSEVLDAQRMQLETDVQVAKLSGEADLAWTALEAAVGADLGTVPRATAASAEPTGKE